MTTLLAFIFAIGLLVTIHELGHYSVARFFKVKILRFSVGFGPVIYKRKDKYDTEWALSAIPLGGYVKMLDEREGAVAPHLESHAFNRKPVWQRFAIVAGGPLANLLLAALIYTGINLYGTEQPVAILAQPESGTLAQKAGFQSGDRILAINNQSIAAWGDAQFSIFQLIEDGRYQDQPDTEIKVMDVHGNTFIRPVNFSYVSVSSDPQANPVGELGFSLGRSVVTIMQLEPNEPAMNAGLLVGDRILSANDIRFPTATQLHELIRGQAGQVVRLSVERDTGSSPLVIDIQPREFKLDNQIIGRIGVRFSDTQFTMVRYGFFESMIRGVKSTYEKSAFSIKMMLKIVLGEHSWRNISGPITIADYAGQTAKLGLMTYISFVALVSVSIGVLNLLPIPVLDGGHLVFYLIEMVSGKPVPEAWISIAQRLGLVLLLMLMGVAMFNDFFRIFN